MNVRVSFEEETSTVMLADSLGLSEREVVARYKEGQASRYAFAGLIKAWDANVFG